MEATSIYHERLAKYLFDAGYQVCVTNPARARYFAQSISKLNKTDKADSEVLARFAMTADLHFWQKPFIQSWLFQNTCWFIYGNPCRNSA